MVLSNNAAMEVNKKTNDYLQLIDDDVDNIKIIGDHSNNGNKTNDSDSIRVIVDDGDNFQHSDGNSQATSSKDHEYLQVFEDDYLQVVNNYCGNAEITDGNFDQNSYGVTGNDNYCQMVDDDNNSLQFTGNNCDLNNYEILKPMKQASLAVMLHCT